MASDIGVSEGAAGQTVTLTALLAGFAAPTVAMVIGRLDRKVVTLGLLALVIISNLLVGFATDYLVLLAARMLLGVAIGGFFALVAATVVRLVTLASMGKGMSMVFFGLSAATVAAPPLGALIGEAFGWRTAFLVAAGAGAVAFIALALCLPGVPASGATSLKSLFGLFGRGKIRVGLLVVLLFFGGHFAGFTFIRPYLETGARLDVGAVAAVLFVYGIATLAGNALGGVAADRVLRGGSFAFTGGGFHGDPHARWLVDDGMAPAFVPSATRNSSSTTSGRDGCPSGE
jgi:DHA1 family purine ribonucleoside efflux pump-like MFS transporter